MRIAWASPPSVHPTTSAMTGPTRCACWRSRAGTAVFKAAPPTSTVPITRLASPTMISRTTAFECATTSLSAMPIARQTTRPIAARAWSSPTAIWAARPAFHRAARPLLAPAIWGVGHSAPPGAGGNASPTIARPRSRPAQRGRGSGLRWASRFVARESPRRRASRR